jgi:hypothetical protein
LGRLIIEDEERHHEVLREISARVESWMQGEDHELGTPGLTPRVDVGLLEETRRLIALERADARELRLLERELRSVPPTSLLPLLVRLMRHDTARHVEILRFVRSYTG